MKSWSVIFKAEIESYAHDSIEDAIDELIANLNDYAPAVSLLERKIEIRVSVEASSAIAAISDAHNLLVKTAETIGIEINNILYTSAIADDEFTVQLAESNLPNVLGVSEAAQLLGVSKQRVSELAQQNAFPQPIVKLASGPIWLAATLERFAVTWDRRPGRRAAK